MLSGALRAAPRAAEGQSGSSGPAGGAVKAPWTRTLAPGLGSAGVSLVRL